MYFPVRSQARQGCLFSPLLFSILFKFPARATTQEKETKGMQIRKEGRKTVIICRWYKKSKTSSKSH